MEHQEFSTLPLHDAVLGSIELLWQQKICRFHMAVFSEPGKSAVPHALEFQGVTAVELPHHEPWGASSSVLSGACESGVYCIQMQSGDTIEVTACAFKLVAL